ncbi:MAG: DUF4837 family protein [Bacteroidales bacterium]
MNTRGYKIRYRFMLLIAITAILITACDKKPGEKPSSSGKTCEILLVADKSLIDGAINDSLKAFFMQEQQGLNQSEPLFTMPLLSVSAFEDAEMFQAHRNIIMININDSCKEKLDIMKNFKSKPQIVFILNAPNKEAFLHLFAEKKEMIKNTFDETERIRINQAFKAVEEVGTRNAVSKIFNFSMVFPNGFKVAKKTRDFAWIRQESKEYSEAVLIYTCPYTDKKQLNTQHIIDLRDSLTKQYVPGPTEGSYMTTEKEFGPTSKEINFNGKYAIEIRGLWKLKGDFMGGPFINYTFVDEKNNRIIMLDGFLYSPKKPKRDLLKQIESIIYSYMPM